VASYALEIKKSAAKELADLPSKELARIIERIQSLAILPRPSGAEKLSGDDKYRIRQGDYRVLYEIDDDAHKVTIVKVAHRREVYRK
jgi:mRNA interferase RelE/StbE